MMRTQEPNAADAMVARELEGGGGQKSPQTAMMIDDRQLQKRWRCRRCNRRRGRHDGTRKGVVFNDDHGDYLGDFKLFKVGPTHPDGACHPA